VDGVCCNAPCLGQCEACDASGAAGTCVPVADAPHGDRPQCEAGDSTNVCTARSCDGTTRDSCAGFADTTTTCRPASCDANTGIGTFAATCDGQGACRASETKVCEPYVCAGDACGSAPCDDDADCSAKFRCALGQSGVKDCISRDVATCDGDHTVTAADGTTETDCSPFRCDASGTCKDSCSTTADCVTGYICDVSGGARCVKADAGAPDEEGGCGCRTASGRRDVTALGMLPVLAFLLRRRRQRSRIVQKGIAS
jgi:MYXO-CTERM domain-containing protein